MKGSTYVDLTAEEKQEAQDAFRATGEINGVPLKAWLYIDEDWIVSFSTIYNLTAQLKYQTERAEANWRALCACRNEGD